MRTIKQQARVAGFWYLLLALTAPLGLIYVPGKIRVPGDAAATAENLRSMESLFRLGIGSELLHQVLGIFMALALYRLFKPVDEWLARQLLILGSLVSVPIMFANTLNDVAALTLAKGGGFIAQGSASLAAFDRSQLDALAYFFLQLHGHGVTVASIFWGLWLLPFGLLVVRCGFIPRILGYLLWAAGLGYVLEAFATLVMPELKPYTSPMALPLELGELPIIFWLAIWGARTPRSETVSAQSSGSEAGGSQ
jgi:hypothetical protein